MKVHLKDSDERRHYLIKKFNTLDTKVQTLYTGEFTTSSKEDAIRHSHNFIEMMFVVTGGGVIEINGKLNKATIGDIIIYRPSNVHCEWSNSSEDINALFFGVKWTENLKLMFEAAEIKDIIHTEERYNEFYNLFRLLVTESKQIDENYTDKIVNCVAKTIILKILQRTGVTETNISNDVVDKIKKYIDLNYHNEINLNVLYQQLFVSKFYASRLFKQYIGTTPVSYIVNKRIEEARLLLLTTQLSISNISQKVGYKDIYYFTKSFKQIVGVTPTAYREFSKKEKKM